MPAYPVSNLRIVDTTTHRTVDMINAQGTHAESPCEVFPQWHEAQLAVGGLAREPRVASPC